MTTFDLHHEPTLQLVPDADKEQVPVAATPPRAAVVQSDQSGPEVPLVYVKRAKILIVDDEPLNIRVVEKHLREMGCERLVHTTDSSLALELIRDEQPDLVLLDIMMPRVNGLVLLRQIRAEHQLRLLPVVILTAYSDSETRCEALESGATDFLAKPVDPHELAPRVRNVLAMKAYQDELAGRARQLEHEVLHQSEELAKARHQTQLRYLAGKAEIATDVLHNVGNALHSVNVGVNLVAYTVRESKLQSLKRATDLLQQHESNVGRFLTKDARGKILPSYLVELTDALLQERDKITGEIELLTKHLEHINTVVATQQKYAALCNVNEDVSLAELLMDVEELVGGSFARHGVEVVRDYQDIPTVNTDRQKLLQVLLNIVKNAMDSIKLARRSGMGRLDLRFGSRDTQRAFIEVSDNGVGIPQESLLKIFAHGFTTKEGGHGFGLHSCANIMKEIGGSIQAYSDGPGRGAKFTLELPFASERTKS